MSTARAPGWRAASNAPTLLLLLLLALLPEGCVTASMWKRLDHSRGERIAAVALTPLTVALDAVVIAGGACAYAGCGCCCSR